MSIDEFERLLAKPESSILDFKEAQYKFSLENKTAEYIKDVIAFSNTIRAETAHIILGVRANINGTKELLGIDDHIDDSVFQEKAKDKVYPKPTFQYYTLTYQGKTFGVFEFPVTRYSEPIAPVVKIKGLDVGEVYFRRGSSNSEAVGKEVIRINSWITNLPDHSTATNKNERISSLLVDITSKRMPLSECIADALSFSRDYNEKSLGAFCRGELLGWNSLSDDKKDIEQLDYRIEDVLLTSQSVEINPYYQGNYDRLYTELKRQKGVSEVKMRFPDSVSKIEEYLVNFTRRGNNALATYSMSASSLFPDTDYGQLKANIYFTRDTYDNLYSAIRQKLISLLMACM